MASHRRRKETDQPMGGSSRPCRTSRPCRRCRIDGTRRRRRLERAESVRSAGSHFSGPGVFSPGRVLCTRAMCSFCARAPRRVRRNFNLPDDPHVQAVFRCDLSRARPLPHAGPWKSGTASSWVSTTTATPGATLPVHVAVPVFADKCERRPRSIRISSPCLAPVFRNALARPSVSGPRAHTPRPHGCRSCWTRWTRRRARRFRTMWCQA
jgi:hypothetical protein